MKIVGRGTSRKDKRSLALLKNEFNVYCKIEQAKRNGEMGMFVTPGCYGLYRHKTMMVLILDGEGEALTDEEWESLSASDRYAELIKNKIK